MCAIIDRFVYKFDAATFTPKNLVLQNIDYCESETLECFANGRVILQLIRVKRYARLRVRTKTKKEEDYQSALPDEAITLARTTTSYRILS